MSNLAFMSVCFEGKRRELRSLYGKMKRLQERKHPLVDNDFYCPTRWLGNLVVSLGADYQEVYCCGTWDGLNLNGNILSFNTETASKPPFRLLKLISDVYPSLKFYFEAEGDDWDCFLTNDAEGKYYPNRYLVDSDLGYEYFVKIEEVCQFLSPHINLSEQNEEMLAHAIDEWEENNTEQKSYIIIKKSEVLSNDELWD